MEAPRTKTLVYANTGLSSKQIGLTGEILTKLGSENKEISLVYCDNVLDNCYFNRSHNVLACASCQSRQEKIVSWSNIAIEKRLYLKKYEKAYGHKVPNFENLDALLYYRYGGIQVGRGVASSIISYTRDYHITSEKYGPLIAIELRKAINVYLNFKEILSQEQPDEIYLFNGRFSEVWPVIELAQRLQIPYYTMEAGVGTNYEIFENNLPHSIALRDRHIRQYWEAAETKQRIETSHEWYQHRKKGIESYDRSFTAKQETNLLPSDFDQTKRNIAIFNSSEDELKAIMEWETDLYKFQNEAILKIVRLFDEHPEYHFYLRVHPNLGSVENTQMEEIRQMHEDNLTVIQPNDPIDTYTLMTACEKVVTFGSSTGIEATYWGKASILFGKSFYIHLDAVYRPKSYEELKGLILNKNLMPKPQINTLPYGYYLATYGTKSINFLFNGISRSKFMNRRIRVVYFSTIGNIWRYLRRIPLWRKLHKVYFQRPFRLKDIFSYK